MPEGTSCHLFKNFRKYLTKCLQNKNKHPIFAIYHRNIAAIRLMRNYKFTTDLNYNLFRF